jgi:hypothetical protein
MVQMISVRRLLTKPATWQFATAQQGVDNIRRLETNEELKAAMIRYGSAPLVSMLKFPEPYDDINPSFTAKVRPLGTLKGKDPKDILTLVLSQMQRSFKEFVIVQPAADVTVSGLPGAHGRVNYTLEVSNLGSFPVTSDLWIIPRGDFVFMLGAGLRQDEKTGSRAEVQAIFDTVRIDP